MTFLNPGILAAGLACVSIPIIIHLLMHRRRKPVVWGAMRFLLEAYRRQQRRLKLEKWLLLALRCLLVAIVAFALGRPLLGAALRSQGATTLFIVIDNSLTSSVRPSAGSAIALENHKAAARALLSSLRLRPGEGHAAGLIALGAPADAMVNPPSTDLGAIEALINRLEPTDSRADFAGAMSAITQTLRASATGGEQRSGSVIDPRSCVVAIVSDFREGSISLGESDAPRLSPLPEGVRVLATEPAKGGVSNISIVGVEPLRSMVILNARDPEGELVRLSLRRSGTSESTEQTTRVRARLAMLENNDQHTEQAASWGETLVRWDRSQQTAQAVVSIRGTAQARTESGAARLGARSSAVIVASVDDADAIENDNRFRRPLDVRDALRVGIVAPSRFGGSERADRLDPGAWMRLALAPGTGTGTEASTPGPGSGGLEIVDIEPASIDAARLAGLDAVVLARPDLIPQTSWARLRVFLDAGGLVLLMPPPDVSVHLWTDDMSKAFGVNWSLSRESQAVPQDLAEAGIVRVREQGRGASGEGVAAGAREDSPLALIEGELDELLRPVTVLRVLAMLPAPSNGRTLFKIGESPLLWVGPPGGEASRQPGDETSAATVATSAPSPAARGLIVYLAAALDLEWTDLPAKPLMVPLMQELVRQGVGRARGTFVVRAGERAGAPSRSVQLEPIEDPVIAGRTVSRGEAAGSGRGVSAARVDALGVMPAQRRSGVLRALDESGGARSVVAVNADERAGRVNMQDRSRVQTWLQGLTRAPGSEAGGAAGAGAGASTSSAWNVTWFDPGSGKGPDWGDSSSGGDAARRAGADRSNIWWILLTGALVLCVAELVVARWSSHATLAGDSPGGVSGDRGTTAQEAAT